MIAPYTSSFHISFSFSAYNYDIACRVVVMAFTRLSFPFSLLLLSLIVIAFAGDYGNDLSNYGYDGIPDDNPQPKPKGEVKPEDGLKSKGEEKPNYGAKPGIYKPKPEEKHGYERKPEGEVKPKYGSKPDGEEKPSYDAKPGIYKPKPKEKSGYDKKPPGEKKPNYGTKQYNYKSKPEEKEKKLYVVRPKPEGEEKPNYDTRPKSYKPKPEENKKPEYGTKPEENEKLLSIGVEGLILCKSGPKYYPIQGNVSFDIVTFFRRRLSTLLQFYSYFL